MRRPKFTRVLWRAEGVYYGSPECFDCYKSELRTNRLPEIATGEA